ncbi:hypothetical protein DKP78_20555, partial [Enterococcus faecium]
VFCNKDNHYKRRWSAEISQNKLQPARGSFTSLSLPRVTESTGLTLSGGDLPQLTGDGRVRVGI